MASNRIRALRNVSNRLTRVQSRLGYLDRRPAPRRLADNFIFTNNIRRLAIVNPLVASDAIENDNLADDSVDTNEITQDAMTGKNINSCDISNSTFSSGEISESTLTDIETENVNGSEYTIDGLVLTNGEITETTLTGAEVVLTNCTLVTCSADTIVSEGNLNLSPSADLGINSTGLSVNAGGGTMTLTGTNFGLNAGGSGISVGSGIQLDTPGGYENVTFSGQVMTPRTLFLNEIERLEDLIESTKNNLQSQINGKADAGHSHPGL